MTDFSEYTTSVLGIVDRRLNGKNKSIGNRERFLRRHKDVIREAVRKHIAKDGIKQIGGNTDISIPKRDLQEPVFGHGNGGKREMVHPGNKDYVRGDKIERPKGGQGGGGGGGQASDQGEGEDDFTFNLTKEEFMEIFFEDLALPNLVRSAVPEIPEYKSRRAGFSSSGNPSTLSVERSMRKSIGRKMALHASPSESRRKEIEEEVAHFSDLFNALSDDEKLSDRGLRYTEEIAHRAKVLARTGGHVPYLDPIDLRYRSRVQTPVPISKAVMFCLMDVSGSMDESRKDLSKRFFILLYLFLSKSHDNKVDIVFLRHHTQAQEVDEENFFHAKETGGTVVSSVLTLMQDIIKERYSGPEWNIYGAQASDGDNSGNDSGRCRELLKNDLLPLLRYFYYIQVAKEEQNLWDEYAALAEEVPNFAMRKVTQTSDIHPVFRDMFKKDRATANAMAAPALQP